jgi:tetratricopeptide (TPR) repeat protein
VAKSQHEQAITYAERAVNVDPNLSYAYLALGQALIMAGRAEEGLAAVQKGMRRDPRHRDVCLLPVTAAYLVEGRYTDAIPVLKRCVTRFRYAIPVHFELLIAHTELGQMQDARAEVAEILGSIQNTLYNVKSAYPKMKHSRGAGGRMKGKRAWHEAR